MQLPMIAVAFAALLASGCHVCALRGEYRGPQRVSQVIAVPPWFEERAPTFTDGRLDEETCARLCPQRTRSCQLATAEPTEAPKNGLVVCHVSEPGGCPPGLLGMRGAPTCARGATSGDPPHHTPGTRR
jgi:hypothetical protein